MDNLINIVLTEIEAVKMKSTSSAMKVKPAFQMVTILLKYILIKSLSINYFNFRKDM